jgi:SAM-dependent methyltransferase
MHSKFLSILICPQTKQELTLNSEITDEKGLIISGELITVDGNVKYRIRNGIPRFVAEEKYTGNFGYEWKKWSRVQFEDENIGKSMEGHTLKMFKAITEFNESDIKDKTIVEFGCGPGRFLDLILKWKGFAVGIDMSNAVDSAAENFKGNPNVLIVQGDILNPPFKSNIFDAGYSIGVLHHTPSPELGLKALVRNVKPNGKIACCVYSYTKGLGFYDSFAVKTFRYLHNHTKITFGNTLPLLYSYIAAYILYYVFFIPKRIPIVRSLINLINAYILPMVYIPDAKWRVLDVFDGITPKYASTHTSSEVKSWFINQNCKDIKQTSWGATSFVANKSNL